jgi:hypothetical protein
VVFINYMLQFIDGAKSPFEKAAFLARVFDTQFPENEHYSELLVAEVPPGQRYNVLVEAYRTRESGRPGKLQYYFRHMLRAVSQDEVSRFCDIVSEELKVTDNESSIRSVRQLLPNEYWPKIAEIARLRVESMFIAAIRQGRYDSTNKRCEGGAFGTWAGGIEQHFVLEDELEGALAEKLGSESEKERRYVLEYFFRRLPEWLAADSWPMGLYIVGRLEAGDDAVAKALQDLISSRDAASWKKEFQPYLEKLAGNPDSGIEPEGVADDVPF